MIKIHLSKLMGINKFTIQNVKNNTGLDRNTIANLYHEKVKQINFTTLEKLCITFDCKTSDIIEYIPD